MTIRTIIVDDEILARIGLRSFIDGQSDIVVKGIFGSGEEALEYLEQNETDVVITDIEMAGLSGLGFISMLRSRGYEGGIVITSCHDDFSYAQEAIRHGTDAYLLKINLDQDKLVSEIRRVFESRTKNAAAFRRGLKQERSIKHDLLLREEGDKMLGAYAGAETAKGGETADRYGNGRLEGAYQVAVLCLKDRQDDRNLSREDSLVENLLDEIVKHYRMGTLFTPYDRESFLLLTYPKEKSRDEILSALRENVDIISKNMMQYLNESVFIGVSRIYDNLRETREKYKEAVCASEMKFYESGARYALFEDLDFSAVLPEIRCDLQSFLSEPEKIKQEIDALCRGAEEAGMPVDTFREEFSRVMNSLTLEYMKDAYFRDHLLEKWEQCVCYALVLREAGSIKELGIKLGEAMDHFRTQIGPSPDSKTIDMVTRYIDEHLQQDLTLPDLAARAGMSVPSFCRHFKECMGTTTTQYINEQRIGKAKTMLLAGSSSLADIAYECGFANDNYFVRVFKKVTGTTVSEFREKKVNVI